VCEPELTSLPITIKNPVAEKSWGFLLAVA